MNVLPPARARLEYVQRLLASPDRVFPLLCPVREVEWASDWQPLEIYTESGLVEPGCVFTTAEPDGGQATWVVTDHDPVAHRLEIVKVTPGLLATRIEIVLAPAGDDATDARIAYTHTALSPTGREQLERLGGEAWNAFMTGWERELNHHLATAEPLDETGMRYE